MTDLLAFTAEALTALAVALATFVGARAAGGALRRRIGPVGLAQRLGHLVPAEVHERLGRSITRAGGLGGLTSTELVGRALLLVVAAVVVGVVTEVATGVSPAWVLAAGGLAAALPFVWLRDRVAGRHDEILRDLPYDLDLLTLSVEAGLDFTAAVQKVVDRGKRGPLRDELQAFLAALRMGKTRAGALAAMGERVGLPELASVVSALVQADHLGTGLARTLRAQAEQLRVERFQRAETRAGEAPVRMLVPLVLFVFPTLWIVLGAPLVFEYFFAGR